MAIKRENVPKPEILMNSMRSIGYSFDSAVADILDNSVSAGAGNIWIDVPTYNDGHPYLSILDDGCGMDDVGLFNAMKYGSERDEYGEKDLGRFGLGLKSASLSQCRVLTVVSKYDGKINGYRWDLDEVIKAKEWCCLELEENELAVCPNIGRLSDLDSGTLVIWQNFDFADKEKRENIYEALSDNVCGCEDHIRLIFHRFINRKEFPISILINNRKLIGLDPFLEGTPYHGRNPKTDFGKISEINVPYRENGIQGEAMIKIQTCTLPHQNDLSEEDFDALGGMDRFRDGQGFYIYRNDRLIIYGTWFGMTSRNVNVELYKYGRIKVDIPNTLDNLWEIDIKKQSAVIPKSIQNLLKGSISDVCERSRGKSEKRARLNSDRGSDEIWLKTESRNGKDLFSVNVESDFVRRQLDHIDEKDRARVIRLLEGISARLPFDDIYISVCNKNNETELSDDAEESLLSIGYEEFALTKKICQCSDDEALNQIITKPPFLGDDDLIKKLKRMVEFHENRFEK